MRVKTYSIRGKTIREFPGPKRVKDQTRCRWELIVCPPRILPPERKKENDGTNTPIRGPLPGPVRPVVGGSFRPVATLCHVKYLRLLCDGFENLSCSFFFFSPSSSLFLAFRAVEYISA